MINSFTFSLGQCNLAPIKKISKDFLKDFFAGRKHLLPRTQLRLIKFPHYDDLSVVHLIKDILTKP